MELKMDGVQQQHSIYHVNSHQYHQHLHNNQLHHNHQLQQQEQQQPTDDMIQQLMILVQETQRTDLLVQSSRDAYQDFVIQLQTRGRLLASINYSNCSEQYAARHDTTVTHAELKKIQELLRLKAAELDQLRRNLVKAHVEIFNRLLVLQNKTLYEYLPKWHLEQQLNNNGAELETVNLDKIQQCVEKIVEVIWKIKNQIKGLQLTLTDKPNVPFDTDDLDRFVICLNKALENLILNTFIVEKQPPQVMKTNTRFQATVRFLCGNKLNVQLINPTVKALILSEANARTVIRYHKQLIENSWTNLERQHQPQPQPQPDQLSLQNSDGQSQAPAEYSPVSGAQVDQSSVLVLTNSPEQSISISNSNQSMPSPRPQFFQQQHPAQQQFMTNLQQPQQQVAGSINQTQIQFRQVPQQHNITEIGYNPDVPINAKEFESSGEILNNSNILEFQEQTSHMISHFRNMQLKKIKRTEKKGTESVMDEKFVLLFFTEFRVADDSFLPYSIKNASRVKRGDLLFHILAFSLPVVVIVHGNQEPHAWATVTWHNAFATQDELLYRVPDKVPWRDLGHVLSEKFRSCTGRGLSMQNLTYLASKVTRSEPESDDIIVTWTQFAKEPLAEKSFTFWEWFHSILKLTKEHFADLWKAEHIYGFVGKRGCVDLLLGSAYTDPAPIGTFLLRYSETELGGITIAWVSSSSELSSLNPSLNDRVQISQRMSPTNPSPNVVMHLQPFLGRDLITRGLADRIRDLKDLIFLYPNCPKDEAFKAYYTPIKPISRSDPQTDYIKSMLVTTLAAKYPASLNTVAAQIGGGGGSELSVTPNSISHSSPEGFYNENSGVLQVGAGEIMDTSGYQGYEPAEYGNYTVQ